MSVTLAANRVHLTGECPAADAEALLGLLLEDLSRIVDLSAACSLHTAVIQVLLAFRPPIAGPIRDPLVASWLTSRLAFAPDARI